MVPVFLKTSDFQWTAKGLVRTVRTVWNKVFQCVFSTADPSQDVKMLHEASGSDIDFERKILG